MSKTCPHAASGCDYPAGECAGHCSSKQQPKALRLADDLQSAVQVYPQMSEDEPSCYRRLEDALMDDAAAELRRLQAENEDFRATCDHLTRENAGQIGEIVALKEQRDALLEALRMNAQSLAWLANGKCRGFHPGLPTADESLDAARSAIAKAGGAA